MSGKPTSIERISHEETEDLGVPAGIVIITDPTTGKRKAALADPFHVDIPETDSAKERPRSPYDVRLPREKTTGVKK